MTIALDATYSLGKNLSGVGVYSRRILYGLAAAHRHQPFLWYYRSHRFLRSLRERLPSNATRRLLKSSGAVLDGELFHALNQRVDRMGARTISTFHDLFVITGDYSTPDFRERFTQQARNAAERSDLIIAVSAFTARQVEQHLNIDPVRIRVIPHGVDLPASQPPPPRQRQPMVLCVGAIQRRKNIARLVQAFAGMPRGWRLIVAGAADGFGAEEELAAVETSPRRDDIEVLGYVSQDALDRLYSQAAIVAFPSLDEGFGMPVLEAMARGVPVVTSDRSALPEVAGDAALLVDPFDVEAIGNALRRLATDSELRNEMTQRGLDRARQFPWQIAVDRTWDVYRELLGRDS